MTNIYIAPIYTFWLSQMSHIFFSSQATYAQPKSSAFIWDIVSNEMCYGDSILWYTHCVWWSVDKSTLTLRAVQLICFRGFAHPLQIGYWFDVKDLWPVQYLWVILTQEKKYMARNQNTSNYFVHSILNLVCYAPAFNNTLVSVTLICHSTRNITLGR